MRTAVRIDDALLRKAKKLAEKAGTPVERFINDCLRLTLSSPP